MKLPERIEADDLDLMRKEWELINVGIWWDPDNEGFSVVCGGFAMAVYEAGKGYYKLRQRMPQRMMDDLVGE